MLAVVENQRSDSPSVPQSVSQPVPTVRVGGSRVQEPDPQ